MTLINPKVQAMLDEIVQWADDQEHDILRADAAITAMKQLQETLPLLRQIRVEALRNLYLTGWTDGDLAKELGVSRARIYQLTTDGKPKGKVDRSEWE